MTKREGKLVQAWLKEDIEQDAAALEIIDKLQSQGWTQKQIIVDAVLRASGHTPEMYADLADPKNAALVRVLKRTMSQLLRQQTQEMLEAFGDELLTKIKLEGVESFEAKPSSPFGSHSDKQVTSSMKNLAAGFMARQQNIPDDE